MTARAPDTMAKTLAVGWPEASWTERHGVATAKDGGLSLTATIGDDSRCRITVMHGERHLYTSSGVTPTTAARQARKHLRQLRDDCSLLLWRYDS